MTMTDPNCTRPTFTTSSRSSRTLSAMEKTVRLVVIFRLFNEEKASRNKTNM